MGIPFLLAFLAKKCVHLCNKQSKLDYFIKLKQTNKYMYNKNFTPHSIYLVFLNCLFEDVKVNNKITLFGDVQITITIAYDYKEFTAHFLSQSVVLLRL